MVFHVFSMKASCFHSNPSVLFTLFEHTCRIDLVIASLTVLCSILDVLGTATTPFTLAYFPILHGFIHHT